ncbi:hypothetical protein ACWEPC_28895, partial [Nonomuraea sp. NPDC004297]
GSDIRELDEYATPWEFRNRGDYGDAVRALRKPTAAATPDAPALHLLGYGLTEATCASAATPAFAPRAGSVGLRLPYQHVKADLVADSVRRLPAELAPGAPVDVVLEDGRPVALIGAAPEPAAVLDRYDIAHRTVSA